MEKRNDGWWNTVVGHAVAAFSLTLTLGGCIAWGPQPERLRPTATDARSLFLCQVAEAHGDPAVLDALLDREILAFQSLIEEGLVFRQGTVELARRLRAGRAPGEPLDGADLDALNQNFRNGIELARRVFTVVDVHSCWYSLDDGDLAKAGLRAPPPALRVKGTMLSLAGALFLYDAYRLHAAILLGDDTVRRQMRRGDRGYGITRTQLDAITAEFLSIGHRLQARDQLQYCERNRAAVVAGYGDAPTFRYLDELIRQSPSGQQFLRHALVASSSNVKEGVVKGSGMAKDELQAIAEDSVANLSQFFGNTVGLVETRKGKLWRNPAIQAGVGAELRPGDILLEKTPFRLTDTFIPGHWGHAAIWVGTLADLTALGLQDEPLVRKYQADLRAGRGVCEALRAGVMLNPLADFLNVDDLAILRDTNATPAKTAERVRLALRQVGKAYDFNFDVETTDRIVCSELIYVVFTDFRWPTDRTLGRYTISPDNVAQKILDGGPLQLQLFYHDGSLVAQEPLALMAALMHPRK